MNDNSYIEFKKLSDQAIIVQLGEYIKHHRLIQNKTQEEIAQAANISRSTLSLLERGESVNLLTFIQVLRTLDLLHVMDTFSVKEQISPIALATLDKKKRERARNTPPEDEGKKPDW